MDLERNLLAKLTDPTAVASCWDNGVRAEVFETPLNRDVYDFVVAYWMDSGMEAAPTEGVLQAEFPSYTPEPSSETLTWLTGALARRYATNQAQDIIRDAARTANSDPQGTITELFRRSYAAQNVVQPRRHRVDLSDTTSITAWRERYSHRHDNPGGGAPIGLPEVDEHFGGILPSELAVVAAYTKTGKSFLLAHAAVAAMRAGYKPYVASLEQTTMEFEDRLYAFASGVSYDRISKAQCSMDEIRTIHAAQEEMGPLHLERPDVGDRTVASIMTRARHLGCDYVVIDQLSWLETRRDYSNRRDGYKELIYDLKGDLGRSGHELPCLMAVQFNREAAKGAGGLNNIAESSDIEQTVDRAFSLAQTEELRVNNCMVLRTLGTRRGDPKHWMLAWYLGERTEISVRQEFVDE